MAADAGTALRSLADTAFEPAGRDGDPPLVNVPSGFAQDRHGLLWAGGQSGLFHWDGYRIVQYTAGSRHPDGLRDHLINRLHRDAAGTFWVGTMSGGLARYDELADHFVTVPLTRGAAGQESCNEVRDIADDGAGGLLVATDAGLFRRTGAGQVLWHANTDPAGPPHSPGVLPDAHLRAVLRDRSGRVWVGAVSGLAAGGGAGAAAPGFAAPVFTSVKLAAPGRPEPEVNFLLEDADGAVWIGTHDGAFVLKPGATAPMAIAMPGAALSAHVVMSMAEMLPGEVWIGTYGEGILVARADGSVRRITHDPLQTRGLDSNVVFALYRDRSGLPWVSTPFGISHAEQGEGGVVAALFDHPSAGSGLTVEQPTALLARQDGSLWIGSEADGIEILDAEGHLAGRVAVQPVVALAEAPDGRVFAGGRGGAYVIDAHGHQAAWLEIPGRGVTATVWALAMDGDRLWLGGDGDGVWVLRVGASGQATVIAHLAPPEGSAARIAAIRQAPDGRMAVATGDGLWLVDRTRFARTIVQPDPRRPDALPSRNLASLGVDTKGRLWVGTADAGLGILTDWTGGDAHFVTLGIEDGLGNPDVDGMLADRSGRMWVSTDNGVSVVDSTSFAVRLLSAADGVAVTGFWTGSAARSTDGVLLFGGTGGLLAIQPSLLTSTRYPAPVTATRVLLGGKPAEGWSAGVITLPPGTSSLSVDFAALDYAEPARNRYRYWLQGFDKDWVETDAAHRAAAYTNLPPGDYTLWLAGSDHTGAWSPLLARLAVHVQAAWYQTSVFKLALAAFALAAFAASLHLRTRILRGQQRALERQVADRTAALRESETRLERLANADALTDLPNRHAFNVALRAACSERRGSFALAIVDLDGFKPVNDMFGHDAGDALLTVIAARLRGVVRNTDFIARLGGDEFAILFGDMRDLRVAEQTCERVVAALGETALICERSVRVGASVGIALYPRHGNDPDRLYKSADVAMYEAKRAGRGTWRWFREPFAETGENTEEISLALQER